jgi:hypothetical protein
MQSKGQFLLSKMCEASGTGSGLCDEVAILLVYGRYVVHCQQAREKDGSVAAAGGRDHFLPYTLYLTAGVRSPVALFSVTSKIYSNYRLRMMTLCTP